MAIMNNRMKIIIVITFLLIGTPIMYALHYLFTLNDDPLLSAIHRNDTVAVMNLINADPGIVNRRLSNGATPLHYACSYSNTAAIPVLIEAGANINAKWNGKNGSIMDGATPLHIACGKGDIWTVKYLTGKGADETITNSQGQLPLDQAIKNNRKEVVEYLQSRTSK